MTVSAAEDDDAEVDTATIGHSVAGADYGSVVADDVAVTVTDNETASRGVTLKVDMASLSESATATTVMVTGTLNGAVLTDDATVTVIVGADTDTAAEGTDYSTVGSVTLKINAGSKSGSRTFSLAPTDDDVDEEDESISVSGSVTGLTVTGTTITIKDDDTRGVTLSTTTVVVTEGTSGSYSVVLDSEPTGTVTVTPSVTGSADVELNKDSLSFTPTNWDSAQTVTVSAAEDDDAEVDSATVEHSVTGADYVSVTADDVSVTVTDDDLSSAIVTLSADTVTVHEQAGTTTITLSAELDELVGEAGIDLVIKVGTEDDTAIEGIDYVAVEDTRFAIEPGEFQGTVEIELEITDDDIDEETEYLTVTGSTSISGVRVEGFQLAIADNDQRGVKVEPTSLFVASGGTATYSVVLLSQPVGSVTVQALPNPSSGITCTPKQLYFSESNWNIKQQITVSAEDGSGGLIETIMHDVSGGDYATTPADDVAVESMRRIEVVLDVDRASVDEGSATVEITLTGTYMGSARSNEIPINITVGSVDDDALAGSDYLPMDDFVLTIPARFNQGSVRFTLSLLDDYVEEKDERISLVGATEAPLVLVSGSSITITDDDEFLEYSDFMPDAWFTRFGRTTADQVLKAIEGRLGASRTPGLELNSVSPQRESREDSSSGSRWSMPGFNGTGFRSPEYLGWRYQSRSQQSGLSSPFPFIQGHAPSTVRADDGSSRPTSIADVLDGASFTFNLGPGKRDRLAAVWGHGAATRFEAQQDGTSFDGEVITGLAGVDWTMKRGIAGVLVADSRGVGNFSSSRLGGDLESTMMSIFPWISFALSDSINLTSVAGHGFGDLELTTEETLPISTDATLTMFALDLRGVLISPTALRGFELATSTDALLVKTRLQHAENSAGILRASTSSVTRLRHALEGRWRGIEVGGGRLEPALEIAVRHDDGDAEQGYGADVGGGVNWIDTEHGIEAQFRIRGLLTHEDDEYVEHGISFSVVWEPGAVSKLGPRFTVAQDPGRLAFDRLERVPGKGTTGVWGMNEAFGNLVDMRRRETRLGYGFNLLQGRVVVVPEFGYVHSEDSREKSIAWFVEPTNVGRSSLIFGLSGTGTEMKNGQELRRDLGVIMAWQISGTKAHTQILEVSLEALQRRYRLTDSDIGLRLQFKGSW